MFSLILGYFFLKVMMREAHQRRTKHREVAGASGSSRAPSAQPNNLHEDSFPEDSAPRGATPSTPNELECLKMRSPEVFTNRVMVNYNKVVELRQKACYTKPKEKGTDERFWTFFHQD
jgi:hypothetical protein